MKELKAIVKLQLPAGQATPAPPVGPALGQHGVNIGAFVKEYNDKTRPDQGTVIPVIISVFSDRSFTFVLKTPPASVLIKKAASLAKGAATTGAEKVGKITKSQARAIAEKKLADLNAGSVEAATRMVMGTARSMGVEVVDG
jgi:large subunit ribosomal protein L11